MILFRADGNAKVGYGHVMRCLSLADAFRSMGETCKFVLAGDDLKQRIEERGYETFLLSTAFDEMEAELPQLQKLLKEQNPTLLIVDSYYVSEAYFKALRGLGVKIVYVDDLGLAPYEVDALLNYNLYATSIDYASLYANETLPKLLLGTTYVPLRAQYANVTPKETPKQVKNIFISTGGTDLIGLSKSLFDYVIGHREETIENTGFQYHFLLGGGNPFKDEILRGAEKEVSIKAYLNIPSIKPLLETCDLALSAAGSTLYEICALGVPCITYVLADNQLQGNHAFEESGLMQSLGDLRDKENLGEQAFKAIKSLADDYDRRVQISLKMQAFVDGHGAENAAKALLAL
ncbi:MAG: UDP-2,4-diacetamido-2,4,6-trideoxy-beta-L-altropyranose hydrolase [Lachnospiraceae bacterium]|nr:UDP-2,4-diacetamido-2,4,6-trideoxy-beta-L-altropyranose hydrolase [Lachnospiraceae bacterium]